MFSKEYFIEIAIFICSASSMYVLWVFLHFIASHIYIEHCVGKTFIDIIFSVIYTSSPYCQGLSWMIYTGSRQIATMWMVLGTYVSSKLMKGLFQK